MAGVSSLLEMPTDSCHFTCASDTLVRPQYSLAQKALSATRGSARGEVFLLTVGVFLLRVKFLCLQSLKALVRRTFLL